MNRKKIKKILPFILILLCMTVIFLFSSQNSEKNNDISLSLTEKLISFIFDNYEIQSDEVRNYVLLSMHIIVRKTAHFILYFILGIIIYSFVYNRKKDFRKSFKISFVFPLVYAATDEIHQLFTDGRTARISDVFIDGFGAVCGSLIAFAVIACIDYVKNTKVQ